MSKRLIEGRCTKVGDFNIIYSRLSIGRGPFTLDGQHHWALKLMNSCGLHN